MVPKTENGQTVLVKVGRPLTASNEHELRKKMQNRVSAIEARMRKKRKMEELEEKVNALTKENETLRIENARLSCKVIDWDQKSAVQMTLSNSAPQQPPLSSTPVGRPMPSPSPVRAPVETSVTQPMTEPKVEPADPPNTINTAPPQMEPILYDTHKFSSQIQSYYACAPPTVQHAPHIHPHSVVMPPTTENYQPRDDTHEHGWHPRSQPTGHSTHRSAYVPEISEFDFINFMQNI